MARRARDGAWVAKLYEDAEQQLASGSDPSKLLKKALNRTFDLHDFDPAVQDQLAAMTRWLGLSTMANGDAEAAHSILESALRCTRDIQSRATLLYEIGLARLLSTMDAPQEEGRFPSTPIFSLLPSTNEYLVATGPRDWILLVETTPKRAELRQGPRTHLEWLHAARTCEQSLDLVATDPARSLARLCYWLAGMRADTASPRKRLRWLRRAHAHGDEEPSALHELEQLSPLARWLRRLARFPTAETFQVISLEAPHSLSMANGPWLVIEPCDP